MQKTMPDNPGHTVPPAGGVTVLTLDPDGKVLSVNPDFEATAGYSRSIVLGKRIADLGNERDVHLFRFLQTALGSQETPSGAASHGWEETRDGSTEVSIFPVEDSVGCTSQFVAIRREIASLQEEAPAIQTGAQIERIGRITGSFAHHFNNMLTSVIGYADLVKGRLAEGDPARAHAEMIIKSAGRGSLMISRLLAFGRKVYLRPLPLDLNALILAMKPRIRMVLGSGIDFETRLAPGLDPAYSDPEQLERVLMDLVVNSCEAMPDGGRLVLGTARIEVDRPRNRQGIRIAAGTYAAISLRDTGVGMDDRTRAMVFDPFFTTKHGALGLGLSSAYGFVKQSGGYIWVHGRPGKGALVTLYLPVMRWDNPEASGEPN